MPSVIEPAGGHFEPPPTLSIPEIRDYHKINAELVALLDRGHRFVRLDGAEGQRLLASGLVGSWQATIEILGRTGPEAVSGLNAPGLTVIARGPTADGAGRGLITGQVVFFGDAGDAVGTCQSGGLLVFTGSVGHRAGLAQSGGTMAVLGSVGRLVCDRQSAGRLFVAGEIGPHEGRGRRGGRLLGPDEIIRLDATEVEAWRSVLDLVSGLVAPG